ncbi:4-hydroxy-tetrahydrodipicolinate synthase 2 [Nocardioides sp. OK12]|uniref:4-hydroxy-tetrahydrodipicolinate synthase n=1 Tax=Nocardioides marinisabuli TaxID=419476 RepID=A0A7Y9F316_9ACTN|nr:MULTISPECIES: 4-hydroxy-tetrahydrodipicolinate synthase [Nocardioides]NYD58722.1 4-hydroxy-tetrahydrodipicolinate synthase [Nocardioides marinisabuli]GHJ58316.1 4-hydroxy-tetrahydrodipicolinate synthase 2 [Nocardioides sp. OK12]
MTSTPAPTPAPFGRVLTAMATAFHADGSVDLDATARIAVHLVEHGNDGVVVSGTTGESPTTTVAEDGRILAAVKDAVGDRAVVIAGVGTNATAHSIELAQQAEKIGVDGMLLVTPYYNKPGPAGVLHHFRSVSQAADLPVMLYDVPGRTGTTIDMATYEEAITWPTVVAVKDAVGDLVRAVRLGQLGYAVYSGDDEANLGFLAHGAVGFVSVVGHVAGRELRAMADAHAAGDNAGALEIFTRLLPAIDAVMGVANYGATTAKAALQLLGVLENRNVRAPLVALDDDEVAALRVGLVAAGLLPASATEA